MKLKWTRSAPKAPGYYWFLPSRYRSKWDNGRLSDQEPPTVTYLSDDGDWMFAGNDMTMKASELRGRWWPVALDPPAFNGSPS